jgi:hypothetical protein
VGCQSASLYPSPFLLIVVAASPAFLITSVFLLTAVAVCRYVLNDFLYFLFHLFAVWFGSSLASLPLHSSLFLCFPISISTVCIHHLLLLFFSPLCLLGVCCLLSLHWSFPALPLFLSPLQHSHHLLCLYPSRHIHGRDLSALWPHLRKLFLYLNLWIQIYSSPPLPSSGLLALSYLPQPPPHQPHPHWSSPAVTKAPSSSDLHRFPPRCLALDFFRHHF